MIQKSSLIQYPLFVSQALTGHNQRSVALGKTVFADLPCVPTSLPIPLQAVDGGGRQSRRIGANQGRQCLAEVTGGKAFRLQ